MSPSPGKILKRLSGARRELGWRLKQALPHSLSPRAKHAPRDAGKLISDFTPVQTGRRLELQRRYPIDDWPRLCNRREYRENLYLLDVLDRYPGNAAAKTPGLDIGCRNFSHLPALSAFAPGPWHGVELDAHARYWNGLTRRACGEWMARQRPDSRYIAGSLLELEGPYRLIIWILPFVVPEPLRAWGLPERYFQPRELLRKARKLLAEDGLLLIVNQGEREAGVQRRLLDELALDASGPEEIASVFSPFRNRRFGWLLRGGDAGR